MEKTLPRILVVEDEAFMLKIYKVKLKNAGFEVETASDGEEALAKSKQGQYSLILLDLILPKMDGFQVLEQIKTDPLTKNVTVLVTSNLSQQSDVKKARELGAADYFIKTNISINELVNKVISYVKKQ